MRDGIDRAGGPVAFSLAQWDYFAPLTAALRRELPKGGRVLDVGCGGGLYPSLLAHCGYDVTGVDNDPDIVRLATEMGQYVRSPATFAVADAFDLTPWHGRVDLVYSLGVVEHFDPDVSVRLIEEQARCAPLVAVVVPTVHMHYCGPPADERLHSLRVWKTLVAGAGLRVIDAFVFGPVPALSERLIARLLPPPLARCARRLLGLGMNICCIGRR